MFPTLEDIAKRRRQLGLKQSELAKMAGVSQSLIAKLEAGTIESSYTKVKTIFDVLERLEFKSKIQVEKVLHNEVVTVQTSEPISKVVKLMKDHGYSQIPIFEGKQSVGSISEKTILRQILEGKDLEQISALPTEKIMEEAFPQINEDAPLSLITSLLQTYSAVLVTRKGVVIGIITKADLLRML
jgi:predicted transcriptional regulator